MERIETRDLPLTGIQGDLVEQLKIQRREAAEAYEGVLHILYGRRYPSWQYHLAYGLRDVIDILTRVRQDDLERRRALKPSERDEMLAGTIDRGAGKKYALEEEYRAVSGMYGKLSGIAHRSREAGTGDLLRMLSEAEGILHMLTTPQSVTNEEVDKIMSEEPSVAGARRLISMMRTGATQYRITNRLPASWLDCMDEAGFFKDPKRYWAAHRYLYRCTEYPDKVARIITSYGAGAIESNRLLYVDILKLACGLPTGYAEAIARHVLEADGHRHFMYDPAGYFEVIRHMYENKRDLLATDLLYKALSTLDDPGMYGADHEDVCRQLEETTAVPTADPLPLLKAMADLLDGYIDGTGDGLDSSMSAERPYIADSEENWPDNIKTAMVTHVRDRLAAIGSGRGDLRGALEVISGREHTVWRRMEMHIYGRFPGFDDEVRECGLRYLWQEGVQHEYREMLRERLVSMPDAAEDVIRGIMQGPGAEALDRLARDHGKEMAGVMLDTRRFLRLKAVRDCLDGENLGEYLRLARIHKREGDPGPTEQDMPHLGRSVDEVFENIMTFKLDARVLNEFSDFVKTRPFETPKASMRLAGADPKILDRFFEGLERAIRSGRRIGWEGTVRMIQHVASGFARDADAYDIQATAACGMLRWSFMHGGPDPRYRAQIWDAIQIFMDAPSGRGVFDPDGNMATKMRGRRDVFDPDANMATKMRGRRDGITLLAAVLYARWDRGDGLASEATKALDRYVGDPASHTAARSAVLGSSMQGLSRADGEWASKMAGSVLGGPHGDAFWNGYVMNNDPDEDTFPGLIRWYERFLNGEGAYRGSVMHAATFYHVLVAHVLGMEGAGAILKGFLDSIGDEEEMIQRCIQEISMAADKYKDRGIDWGRTASLWTHPAFLKNDLSGWFTGGRMDGRAITMYAEHVRERARVHAPKFDVTDVLVDELEAYAPGFPLEVAGILEIMVDNPVHGYVPRGIHGILEVLEGAGGKAAESVRIIRERAAALGR